MFRLEGTTIVMSRGDTGALRLHADGGDFAAADRAVFAISNLAGAVVLQRAYELTNGDVTVTLFNHDTDDLRPGNYTWDVRYVINPAYDSRGRIVDGDQVITPNEPMLLKLLPTAGRI